MSLKYLFRDHSTPSRFATHAPACSDWGVFVYCRTSFAEPPPTKCTISTRSPSARIVLAQSARRATFLFNSMAIRAAGSDSFWTRSSRLNSSGNSWLSPFTWMCKFFSRGQDFDGRTIFRSSAISPFASAWIRTAALPSLKSGSEINTTTVPRASVVA